MTGAPLGLILAFLAIAAIACWLSIGVLRMGRVNPISLYVAIWGALLLLYQLPWLDLRPLSLRTFQFVAIATAAFILGSILAWTTVRRRAALRRMAAPEVPTYDDARLIRLHIAGVVALSGYMVLQIVRVLPDLQAAGGIRAILGGSGIDVRRAYLSAAISSSQTTLEGGSSLLGVLGYVLFLGVITVFWSGYLARRGRYALAALPLLILALQSLILLQRSDFVYALLLFAFSWMYHRGVHSSRHRVARTRSRIPVVAAMLLVLPTVIVVPLLIRQPDLSGGQLAQNVTTYSVGGLAGLNALMIDDPSLTSAASPLTALNALTSANIVTPLRSVPQPTRGGGVWSFFGAASVLSRLGLPVGVPSNFFAYETIQTRGSGLSNVYTYLIYAYFDFGSAGLMLVPFLLGSVTTILHQSVRIRHRWTLIPAAAVFMTTVTMSFFGFSLPRDLRYVVVLAVAPLIGRRLISQFPINSGRLRGLPKSPTEVDARSLHRADVATALTPPAGR